MMIEQATLDEILSAITRAHHRAIEDALTDEQFLDRLAEKIKDKLIAEGKKEAENGQAEQDRT